MASYSDHGGRRADPLHRRDPGGEPLRRTELRLVGDSITTRELIARRVRHEVDAFNAQSGDVFTGLVEPTDAERALNGVRLRTRRTLDASEQIAAACDAFSRGQILLLAGDRQLESLEDRVPILPGLELHFIKLVPLVGG